MYSLYAEIQREAGRLELILGDGIVSWKSPGGDLYHPIILQRLELLFDPEVPEFMVREAEQPPELYTALLRAGKVDGRIVAGFRDDFTAGAYHPLSTEATSRFLRRLATQLSSSGEFVDDDPGNPTVQPRVGRKPVIFLRTRTLGYATALEAILEDIPKTGDLPVSLLNIAGVPRIDRHAGEPIDSAVPEYGNDAEDILFSKDANREQLDVARRLERHGAVVVQGPPGTGKTHTIANLIGHLLAQGKSVLVTSHTAKALTVLRDQIVPELQPLAIAVLQSDAETRKQLEDSVTAIVERLSSGSVEQLEREARALERQRNQVLIDLRSTRAAFLGARQDEYRDIVVAGNGYAPSEAARRVADGRGRHDWIPGPELPGEPLPIAAGEIREIYRLNRRVSSDDEVALTAPLPSPTTFPTPEQFERLIAEASWCPSPEDAKSEGYWTDAARDQDSEYLSNLLFRLQTAAQPLREAAPWQLAPMAAGVRGSASTQPWEALVAEIRQVSNLAAESEDLVVRHGPTLADDVALADQLRVLDEIVTELTRRGKLGVVARWMNRDWKPVLAGIRVSGSLPRTEEQFRAVRARAHLEAARQQLVARWERQMTPLGAPAGHELGPQPEQNCAQFVEAVRAALNWNTHVWQPIEAELIQVGFKWPAWLASQPYNFAPNGDLLRICDVVTGSLPALFNTRIRRIQQVRADKELQELLQRVTSFGSSSMVPAVVQDLRRSIVSRDAAGYDAAFARLVELAGLAEDFRRRQDLLIRLEKTAPRWVEFLSTRKPPHDSSEVPGDIEHAWLWRQLCDELDRRHQVSFDRLERRLTDLSAELKRVTAKLVENKAWAAQIRHTTLPQQQTLIGWLQTIRKIGKGTGKRVPRLRAEARRLMEASQTAAPVWIMPLARVVESFDPRQTRFDVVIIDEASQSDAMTLMALYIARQVIIVGDDQQVSPYAVGQDLDQIQRLIDERLVGIPNKHLYDGQLSMYDLASQAFGGVVCLLEHFRSVPQIIQFSNELSYNWRIRPLRDSSSVQLKPHLVAYRVDSPGTENHVNELEAQTIASMIIAATEQPEYAGKTMGVISLVGREQADRIDQLLREHLDTREYMARCIMCGNSAQFQGDERDAIFLSVVDSPHGTPLTLQDSPSFRKRYNVAASRARDQMWVVHSLNPDIDLKPGDLRLRLIRHAENPNASFQALAQQEGHVESEFERLVLQRLTAAGYRTRAQWEVGYYRIDLVVEGGGKRLAIECDGDRYHPPEKLDEDMQRQAILERLGWTFVRIRGSQFFRDPDAALLPVFAQLE